MKKVSSIVLCAMLVSSQIMAIGITDSVSKLKNFSKETAQKAKRYWTCLTTKDSSCSLQEKRAARTWFIYTPVAVITAVLAVAGIVVTAATVTRLKNKVAETAESKGIDLKPDQQVELHQYEQMETEEAEAPVVTELKKGQNRIEIGKDLSPEQIQAATQMMLPKTKPVEIQPSAPEKKPSSPKNWGNMPTDSQKKEIFKFIDTNHSIIIKAVNALTKQGKALEAKNKKGKATEDEKKQYQCKIIEVYNLVNDTGKELNDFMTTNNIDSSFLYNDKERLLKMQQINSRADVLITQAKDAKKMAGNSCEGLKKQTRGIWGTLFSY